MLSNALRQWLTKLLDMKSLPASNVPRAAKGELTNICDAGFVRRERSGAGMKYWLNDEDAVRHLLQSTGYIGELEGLTPRAKAVALHCNAHRGHDDSMLFLLSSAGNATWTNGEYVLNVSDQVSKFGIASLVVKAGDQWRTEQPLGLVENLDLIIYGKSYCKKINFEGSILYYNGWLSGKLRSWLIEEQRAPEYLILPDYDLVGIKNYLIAKRLLGDSIDLFIPNNLPELLRRHGDPQKLQSKTNRSMIEASKDEKALRLYRSLLEAGRGLDQEGLLLGGPGNQESTEIQ